MTNTLTDKMRTFGMVQKCKTLSVKQTRKIVILFKIDIFSLKIENFSQTLKNIFKIEIALKNRNFGQKSKFVILFKN